MAWAFSKTAVMSPFKPLLSPKSVFVWTADLQTSFEKAKEAIVQAVQDGVKTFSTDRVTCLSTDWSQIGVGAVLWQKICKCSGVSLTCCNGGWVICGVRSRFCDKAKSNYAPIEGEALAVHFGLEVFKHYTLGNPNLYVSVDHKPLVGLFNKKSPCDITNLRLLTIREKLLRWHLFTIYLPGVKNKVPDAASRFPVRGSEEVVALNYLGAWEGLPWPGAVGKGALGLAAILQAGPKLMSQRESAAGSVGDALDEELVNKISCNVISSTGLCVTTLESVKESQSSDETVMRIKEILASGCTEDVEVWKDVGPEFYRVRADMTFVDRVLVRGERLYIPPALRPQVLGTLHMAHQGHTGMNFRAQNSVWWPGITKDVANLRVNCGDCNVQSPSHPAAPPTPLDNPLYPMEQICGDYFTYRSRDYLVLVDRYSNWPTVHLPKNGGANELIRILRNQFCTFGVPVSLATDGGPSFMSYEVGTFLQRWGVSHRVSPAYHPHSNLRAETAVKTIKRLIMDNVAPDGSLNTDKMVAALLQYRNTPDRDVKLSPAQILFGREIPDSLPVKKERYQPRAEWILTADAREKALARRHVMREEVLSEHTKRLPTLDVGDVVLVQNQTGPKSNKWEQSGVVVEVNSFDQYQIKMDGSGWVSLRNHQFLKKIIPVGSLTNSKVREEGSGENSTGPRRSDRLKVKGAVNTVETGHVTFLCQSQLSTTIPEVLNNGSKIVPCGSGYKSYKTALMGPSVTS